MRCRTQRLVALLLLLASWGCVAAQKSLARLEQEADKVLADADNVSRRKNIAPVFELAARYAGTGATNKAIVTYLKALEHQPWNLDGQISVAELLSRTGQTNSAYEKAALVWNRAETDTLLARAATLLRTNFDSKLPSSQPWPDNTNALALVPVGEVDGWLMHDLRRDLQSVLQIPVIVRQTSLSIPTPGRDSLHMRAEELREKITAAKADPGFRNLLRTNNLSVTGNETDEQLFALTEKVLMISRDQEPVRRYREELEFLRRLGPQWDAKALLSEFRVAATAVGGSPKGFLAITKLDLYANQNRYVFGLAENGANCGIISYWRYRSALVEDPPNRDRLRERTLKQALSSVGFIYGVQRCTEPTCARAYANDLTEHDAKQPRLCNQCNDAFNRRFGR
jgi:predicted Zn-dependent protease